MIRAALALAAAALSAGALPARAGPATFHNPILPGRGQDPSILRWNGRYYMVQSRGGLHVLESSTLTDFANARSVPIWSPPPGSDLNEFWAPELVALDGKFYVYFAAAHHGVHESRRMYVLEADAPTGPYRFKGQITDPTDLWAIDGSVLEQGGRRYFVWSGWRENKADQGQNLYIAPMSNPWTISGPRRLLSSPDQPWERIGREPINEGPEALHHDGRLFLVYSASHSMTDDYCLGMLSYRGGAVTERASWTKSDGCVFRKNVAGHVFGPGHNTMVLSPDGRETWNVYHAIRDSGCGWDCRTIRAQRIVWRRDGTPDFGVPAAFRVALPVPSGQRGAAPR